MRKFISIALLGLMTTFMLPAQATPISTTLNLDTVYAGYTPDGTAPWLTATFTSETGSTNGTLTLTSKLGATDFVQGANGVTGWAFYLNSALSDVAFQSGSGVQADTVWTGSIGQQGPVPGTFNLGFGWTSHNRFDGTDTATYTLTFANALTDNPFVANAYGWSSYSHVQGIQGATTCSGYIVSGKGRVGNTSGSCSAIHVPEPKALGMFGFGALLIGLFAGLRLRYRPRLD